MTRSILIASLVGVALMLAGLASADRLGKGRSLVSVSIGGHTGQFVEIFPGLGAAGFPGFVYRVQSGEVGGSIEYDHFVGEHWTLGLTGAYYAGQVRQDDSFGTTTTETHSFTVRVGGDRYAFIDDDVAVFAGPGGFFIRGRVTDGPDATQLGLDARIGMYARLGKSTGLVVHLGQALSHTSGEASEGKISWWSSAPQGSLGLAFDF